MKLHHTVKNKLAIKAYNKFKESVKQNYRGFDYSKSVYINNITKIIIICPHHGEFEQTPNGHLHSKTGCPKCSYAKQAKLITKPDGNTKHPLYCTWCNQVQRSTSIKNRDFKQNYGIRGIDMYLPWTKDFKLWLSYIKTLTNYKECIKNSFNYTIDRVDNNSGYHPMNLRIVEMSVQAFNRRIQSNNTSGVTGIFQRKNRPGWYYELKIKNKRYRKGGFNTMEEALTARNKLIKKHKIDCDKNTYHL